MRPPQNVQISLTIYALSIVVALSAFMPLFTGLPTDRALRFAAATAIYFSTPKVVLLTLFTVKAYRRRNWARFALALWSGLSLLAYFIAGAPLGTRTDLPASLALNGLMIVAAVLLFSRSANAWYQPKKEATGDSAVQGVETDEDGDR